jgi:GTP-binding protein
VLDTATIEPGRNPLDDLDVIEHELARYGGLEDRPRLVALNKVDVPDGREIAEMVIADLRERGLRVFEVSAASGEGTRELIFAMAEIVAASRAEKEIVEPRRIVLRPAGVDGGADFAITQTDDGFVVRGSKPERWVRQTDFTNEEAVGYLADRLNRLGVEDRLLEMGAEEGDTVIIGDPRGAGNDAVVFDFKPSVQAGAEMLGRRGEDQRFYEERPAAARRREIDAGMETKEEHEARADVARRLREGAGPVAYEIGGEDDPDSDWAENDPGESSRSTSGN